MYAQNNHENNVSMTYTVDPQRRRMLLVNVTLNSNLNCNESIV